MRLSSPNNINSDGAIKLNSQKAALPTGEILRRLISVLSAPEPQPAPTANFPHAKLAFWLLLGRMPKVTPAEGETYQDG